MDIGNNALRASDAERSETAELLRRHHAEGRLDTDELEERIERCYAAKTRGELDALTTDLPRSQQQQPRSSRGPRRPPRPLAPFVVIAAIVALSVATGAHVLWLVWPLAFFAFGRFKRGHGWWRMERSRAASWRRFP
jgi:Flp pilus assembly protein TadB